MTTKEVLTYLCYHDIRNENGVKDMIDDPVTYGLDEEYVTSLGPFAMVDCACDNCFYGRHKLANYILKLQTNE